MGARELDPSTLQSFVDEMADPAAILDGDDRFVHLNAAALRLLDRSEPSLVGTALAELCPAAQRARTPGTSQVLEFHCPATDRWYETTLGRVSDGLTLALTRDITERKRDVELREHLFGILGHEIRNPLAAIILSLSLFEGTELSDEQQRALERIGNCARSLRRLTADILDIARSRTGIALPIERRPTDLGAVCREIIDELRYQNRKIELTLSGDTHGVWDEERMAQVITNLLLNAIQYSTLGSAIRVEVAGGDGDVALDVVNRGEPLEPATLSRIFDPLRRAARSDGMGLGLFIVRLIVQAHGGQVGAESAGGETRFWVRLPRARSQPERQIAAVP